MVSEGMTQAAAETRTSPPRSDATRYLCAAMYLDSEQARKVIEEAEDRHHARVSSDGVDLAEVIRHARAALRRHAVRDLFLAILLLILLVGLFGHGLLFLLALAGMWAVVAIDAYLVRYRVLLREIGPRTTTGVAAVSPGVRHRRPSTDGGPRDNVTIYKGFSPFVGFGQVLETWSFSVDCGKPVTPGESTKPFTVAELRTAVAMGIGDLQWDEIDLEDRVFVSGTDIRDDRTLLPDPEKRPVTRIDEGVVYRLMEDPQPIARHYLRASYSGWGDEIVVSVFVRLALHRQSLFVELSVSLLSPIKEAYHEIDDLMPHPTLKQLRALASRSLAQTPRLVLRCIPSIADWVSMSSQLSRAERLQRQEIREHRAFDYGAGPTLRERAADSRYHRYFQRLDKERYVKVIEGRVLSTIAEFLAARGVATSDIEQRQTVILNSGVYVSGGGSLAAGSVAVGEGASARARFGEAVRTAVGRE